MRDFSRFWRDFMRATPPQDPYSARRWYYDPCFWETVIAVYASVVYEDGKREWLRAFRDLRDALWRLKEGKSSPGFWSRLDMELKFLKAQLVLAAFLAYLRGKVVEGMRKEEEVYETSILL